MSTQPQFATELTNAWNESYSRRENHLFWPSDEVVKFFARKVRRRIGPNEYKDIAEHAKGAKMLDVGCGIGRHVKFGQDMGLEMYGSDLSEHAITVAREWLKGDMNGAENKRLIAGDIQKLPWDNGFFDHIMSDSVLDSMPFEVAQVGMSEMARITKSGGYLYCSLISGDETDRDAAFCDEVIVKSQHEQDTIQSYFSYIKVKRLIEPMFEILDCYLIQVKDQRNGTHHGRWHVVARRR